MSKYWGCYEIHKEMIVDIAKQLVIMITITIVWVFDVKKDAYELSDPFAKVGPPQADNNSSSSPENFHKNIFFAKSFDGNILFSYFKLSNKPLIIILMHTRRTNI